MTENTTPGPWNYACDSYGKVRHSRKACVYAGNGSKERPLATVAARIENWSDAKQIAAVPDLISFVRLVDSASESADGGTDKGRAYMARTLVDLGERARALLEMIDSNSAHRNEEYRRALARIERSSGIPPGEKCCELCGEPAGEGGALCPACQESR